MTNLYREYTASQAIIFSFKISGILLDRIWDLVGSAASALIHRVQSLHRKRGRNSGLGVFSRRIAVVFASFAAILEKIFVGELRKSFFKKKKRLCASVKTSSSGSTYISLITKCFADA